MKIKIFKLKINSENTLVIVCCVVNKNIYVHYMVGESNITGQEVVEKYEGQVQCLLVDIKAWASIYGYRMLMY